MGPQTEAIKRLMALMVRMGRKKTASTLPTSTYKNIFLVKLLEIRRLGSFWSTPTTMDF